MLLEESSLWEMICEHIEAEEGERSEEMERLSFSRCREVISVTVEKFHARNHNLDSPVKILLKTPLYSITHNTADLVLGR
jgi:hypothetical protein